jgi:hypothetical protein
MKLCVVAAERGRARGVSQLQLPDMPDEELRRLERNADTEATLNEESKKTGISRAGTRSKRGSTLATRGRYIK